MSTQRMHSRRYPWKRWFDQGSVVLEQDLHFNGMVHTFSIQAYRASKKLGYTIHIKYLTGNTRIQMTASRNGD